MNLALLGLATAVPSRTIEQSAAAELVKPLCCETPEQAKLLGVLYRRTTVRRRASVLIENEGGPTETVQSFFRPLSHPGDSGPTTGERMSVYGPEAEVLATESGGKALEKSGLAPEEITQLITVSCSGFAAPGVDVALMDNLGLSPEVGRTHIGFMGCHGVLNGLRVARGLLEEGEPGSILLVAVELCSLHLQYGWDPERIVANALFADGSGALVLGPEARSTRGWKLLASGSYLFPDSRDAMTWRVADHGFVMSLSPTVPELIGGGLKSWISGWLDGRGLSLEDVPTWAVHPGGPRILSAVETSLSLRKDQMEVSRSVLAEHGNMSSATVVFLLERLIEQGASLPCVALGFGPGLAVEATLFGEGVDR